MTRSPIVLQPNAAGANNLAPYLESQQHNFMPNNVQEDQSNMMLRVRRRKSWFIMTTALTLGVVGGAYTVWPVSYLAQGSVLIAGTSTDSVIAPQSAQAQEKQGDAADIESQLLLLKSSQLLHEILDSNPAIRQAVIQECLNSKSTPIAELKAKIHEGKSCDSILATSEDLVQWLNGNYKIAAAGRSRVISVAYESSDPKIASLMVNTLIDAYVAKGTAEKLRTRGEAASFLVTKLDQLGVDLRNKEQQIEKYRKEHGLIKGQNGSIQAESLSSLNTLLQAAQGARAQALAAMQQSAKGSSTMQNVTNSATITALRSQEAAAAARVAQMSSSYGSNNPILKSAREELNNVRGQIGSEIGRASTGVKQAYDAANNQVQDLQRQIAVLKGEVGTASDAESAMATMLRDLDVQRDQYTDLSKKNNQLEIERRLVAGDTRVVSHADNPTSPWFPKLTPFLAGGGILAVALGFFAAVLRDRADKTVRASIPLEYALGVPVMGRIPSTSKYKQRRIKNGKGTVTVHPLLTKPSALQESIRSLYHECFSITGSDKPKTMMITSSSAGEGKTFLTLALAQFAALSGNRVLAIEGDLRRPTFADRLQAHGTTGLIQYLQPNRIGQAENVLHAVDVIQETAIPGLHLITAGGSAINSSELLTVGKFDQLLSEVKDAYDIILIDSPPSEVLVDARLLAPRVDKILYCAKWGQTTNYTVAQSIAALQTAGGSIIGIALGQVKNGEYKLYETRRTNPSGTYYLGNK